jgi:hypothetical protein
MTAEIHPYYLDKARAALRKASAADDADPAGLARWDQDAQGWGTALATSDGRIVGTGTLICNPDYTGYVVDEETAARYGLDASERQVPRAKGRITQLLGRPVVEFRISECFTGQSERRKNSQKGMEK